MKKKTIVRSLVMLGIFGMIVGSMGIGTKVDAATYYGNGVYCNSQKCWVDWNQAQRAIGRIIVNGWVQNGPWAHR